MEDSNLFQNQDLSSLTEEQLAKVKEYQNLHNRLRILKAQMSEIHEETQEILETLEQLRLKDNKNKNNG